MTNYAQKNICIIYQNQEVTRLLLWWRDFFHVNPRYWIPSWVCISIIWVILAIANMEANLYNPGGERIADSLNMANTERV